MGTRNLTMVYVNKDYRVAQYGQWDGYPEGQGVTVLSFLHDFNKEAFLKNLSECKILKTDQELEEATPSPSLSRNTAAGILRLIETAPQLLYSSLDFAGDSLMCEWAYVIDFDRNTFEVYKGFNKNELGPEDRFHNIPISTYVPQDSLPYQQVKLVVAWDLDSLPTQDEFLEAFKEV